MYGELICVQHLEKNRLGRGHRRIVHRGIEAAIREVTTMIDDAHEATREYKASIRRRNQY